MGSRRLSAELLDLGWGADHVLRFRRRSAPQNFWSRTSSIPNARFAYSDHLPQVVQILPVFALTRNLICLQPPVSVDLRSLGPWHLPLVREVTEPARGVRRGLIHAFALLRAAALSPPGVVVTMDAVVLWPSAYFATRAFVRWPVRRVAHRAEPVVGLLRSSCAFVGPTFSRDRQPRAWRHCARSAPQPSSCPRDAAVPPPAHRDVYSPRERGSPADVTAPHGAAQSHGRGRNPRSFPSWGPVFRRSRRWPWRAWRISSVRSANVAGPVGSRSFPGGLAVTPSRRTHLAHDSLRLGLRRSVRCRFAPSPGSLSLTVRRSACCPCSLSHARR